MYFIVTIDFRVTASDNQLWLGITYQNVQS